MGGFYKDLAFLMLICGIIQNIKQSPYDTGEFDGILADFEKVLEKHKNKKIAPKFNRLFHILIQATQCDDTIELRFVACYLAIVKFSQHERNGVKINDDIFNAFKKNEATLYEIMDKISDNYDQNILVMSQNFVYKIAESL